MCGVEPQITKCCRIGSPFIGDDCSRRETMLLQKLAHQLERSMLVPLGLDEDIKDFAVLIDSPPQIHPATADRDIHLVEMPLWVCPRAPSSQFPRNRWAVPLHPSSNCLIRHFDASFSHKFLDVSEAQVESSIQPNRTLDDRWREVEVSIADYIHPASLTGPAPLTQFSL